MAKAACKATLLYKMSTYTCVYMYIFFYTCLWSCIYTSVDMDLRICVFIDVAMHVRSLHSEQHLT